MSTAPAFGPFTLQTLAANLANLGDKDRAFASDLLKAWGVCQSKGWNFSPGRAKWAAILADRATKPKAAAPEAAEIGSMSGIDALFNSAAKKLQRPAIVLTAKDMDFSLRLTITGNGSKAPGSINVTTNGSFEQREWLGRISGGVFQPGFKAADKAEPTTALLKAFAADPAGVAAAHGKLTGACCFCNRALKDSTSVALGYGPVCADNFGLPYSAQSAKAA